MKSRFIKPMPRILFTLLTLFILPLLFACSAKKEARNPFIFPCEYDVSFQLDEAKGTAKFSFDTEGNLNVLYTDPQSILFGMTEEVREGSVRLLYHNIEWRGSEEQSNAGKFKKIFDVLNTFPFKGGEEETLNHIDCKKYMIFTQEEIITLWLKKEDGAPVRITAEFQDGNCEINF